MPNPNAPVPAPSAPITEEARKEAQALALGAAQIVPEGGLADRIRAARAAGRPLRIKLGVDPSGSELTLGHAVVLRKLRAFQDYGHVAVLIVGDFTGQIGDPSGRTQTRKVLTKEQTEANSRTYMEQALKILREDCLEVHYNSEWLAGTSLADVLRTSRSLTVARLLERDDFARRFREELPITLMEFMYPMLQGMDSVAVQSDLELGGTDQTYNNLVGRALQKDAGQEPQLVMTMPLLQGTDGGEKMGKSLGNWISLNDSADDQYGKIMSISDGLVTHYAELCCGWDADHLAAVSTTVKTDPMAAKISVAHRIVELYHGEDQAGAAKQRFNERFSRRSLPTDLPEFSLAPFGDSISVADVLQAAQLVVSKSEARRLLASDAIRLDGQKLPADPPPFSPADLDGRVLQRGRVRAVRLIAREGHRAE